MSDHVNLEEIERHNVRMARLIRDYWAKQGVEISLTGDPTKDLRSILGPGGLPRGYRGEDAIPPTKGGRRSVQWPSPTADGRAARELF